MGVEEDDNKAGESSEEGSAGPVGGERLAASRRERGISVHEIAKELHLDEPKVRALEENRFDVLGAPVFAKGHMRKYAKLVGVPIDDMLAYPGVKDWWSTRSHWYSAPFAELIEAKISAAGVPNMYGEEAARQSVATDHEQPSD